MPEHGIKTSGFDAIRRQLKAVDDYLGSDVPMQGVCTDVKVGILAKTAKGHDYMNRRFKPYSDAYAKRKGSTHVDLRDNGTMLDSIDAAALSPKHGRVWATEREIIAQFHNQGGPKAGRPPKREFMNISKSGLQKLVTKWYDDVIMKLLGRR